MKKIEIKYNPFLISTEILIDNKKPKANSSLNFGKLRLQEWAGNLPDILVSEYSDKNYEVDFTGTQADFDDLKIAFKSQSKKVEVAVFNHHCTPDVADVEADVDKIFEEIKKGKVDALRDESIIAAFEKAKNQEFEINVIATMSSGKSTLINALLGKQLMPAKMEATTATIVKIIDTDQNSFLAIAFDAFGKEIFRNEDVSLDVMKEWNDDERVSSIEIHGRIPCVDSVGMKLVLVDTPGPNNARDERHKTLTYKMLSDSDKSLVLFVMNGQALGITDEKELLDFVCQCMNSGGKQSRERFIFVMNKMDDFKPNPKDDGLDCIEKALKSAKVDLESRKIYEPNIFPVSSLVALELRSEDEEPFALDNFKRKIRKYDSFHFESYYHYSHLPHVVRLKFEDDLKVADDDTKIEIHSGIVSIEKAIGQYINKYARTIKVYDLVQAFNDRLTELAAIAAIQEEIRQNSAKKEELDLAIREIRNKIQMGQSAQVLAAMIDKIDLMKDVENEVDMCLLSLVAKINKIIFRYNNSSKVLKSEAEKQIKEIQNESDAILNQLNVRIETILNNTFIRLCNIIIDQYKSYIKDLGIVFNDNALSINPLNFVAEELTDLSDLLAEKIKKEDEGQFRNKTIRESYQEKKINWFWKPSQWGAVRYETKYRDKIVREWVTKYVEYVNMSEVVSSYFEPIQLQLDEAKIESLKHVKNETSRIKLSLNQILLDINLVLEQKLNELQISINEANTTAEAIIEQQENLKWMQSIIDRVNKLIKF